MYLVAYVLPPKSKNGEKMVAVLVIRRRHLRRRLSLSGGSGLALACARLWREPKIRFKHGVLFANSARRVEERRARDSEPQLGREAAALSGPRDFSWTESKVGFNLNFKLLLCVSPSLIIVPAVMAAHSPLLCIPLLLLRHLSLPSPLLFGPLAPKR